MNNIVFVKNSLEVFDVSNALASRLAAVQILRPTAKMFFSGKIVVQNHRDRKVMCRVPVGRC